jgi:DNA topoisomerase-1
VSAPARKDAAAAGLHYVSPDGPGISRRRSGKGFRYLSPAGTAVRDAETLARIRGIVIPPAWTDVWISTDPDGHIQATGRDVRGRRQYRYHPRFRARRDRDKFARLVRFGAALPRIRRSVQRDLRRHGLPREKVLAAVIRLLEMSSFRVGNSEYARLNKSFGLSTLRRRHATVTGGTIRFRFRGKGGRLEERALVDRGLAAVVRRCQDLPGQALFQYLDDDGEERAVSSEEVNAYLRAAAGTDEFSAKDFRTWVATVVAHRALREAAERSAGSAVDPVREAIRHTAAALNDTIAVTRSSYVHPAVLDLPPAESAAPTSRAAGERAVSPPGASATSEARGAPTRVQRPIDRRDELAVLATLRAAGSKSARTARRPQVARAGGVGRTRARRP